MLANVFGGILIGTVSLVASTYIGEEIVWEPTHQNFKKITINNPYTRHFVCEYAYRCLPGQR